MRKIIAIGSLLLTSVAAVATPALARDRDDVYVNREYQVRAEQDRRDVRDVRDIRFEHARPVRERVVVTDCR
jgi:hypothetical protein